MSEHHEQTSILERTYGEQPSVQAEGALLWLRGEFPDWEVRIERTADRAGTARPLWVALREGHHPQAELSAAKLHSRLSDYLDRENRRFAARN